MTTPILHTWTDPRGNVGRRDFLRRLSVGAAAVGAAHIGWRDLLIAQAAELRRKQRSMILLWMDGGPSQFESFNPKPGSQNQGSAGSRSSGSPRRGPGERLLEHALTSKTKLVKARTITTGFIG